MVGRAGVIGVSLQELRIVIGRRGVEPPAHRKAHRGWAALGLLPILALLQPAHAATAAPGEPEESGQAPATYLRDCARCHGPAGEGTNRGPALREVGAASADFNLRTGRMPIEEPDQRPRRSEPAYSPREIERMVEFIAGLGSGPEVPSVEPERGDLALGAELFRDNCAACHSVTGTGGAMAQGDIAPTLVGTSPLDVAEAMLIGGDGTFTGSMPTFDSDVFDRQQVNSIVRYVGYLQDTGQRGGASLGRSGPVGEGLVALGIAVPALVLFMYWAGSRK